VTGLGWLGLAQPMWVELGPAPKKYIHIKKRKKIESVEINIFACLRKNVFLLIYSLISG
jgi:hypothetical protein